MSAGEEAAVSGGKGTAEAARRILAAQGAQAAADIEGAVGVGVDIVPIARMEAVLARTPRFAKRVFTEGERAYCDKSGAPAVHYAARFAAKEAVLKALGTGFSSGIAPCDVEIARSKAGRPFVRLHRRAKEVAAELGVRDLPVSLSHTRADAVAFAMAITSASIEAAERRADPAEELARAFKETRAMLDDLPVAGAEAPAEGGAA